ncbi:unnamed protein product [Didymodactylos carnosus]|uniref:TRAF1-6 MATH domain-containing protein n=1 Tax=Didymodactylos carnosus TaxID=1234261 RepID=A0A814NKL7_9BILA|nr:unnamed protein product [Didymodactylos carnosus]CAF3859647.1 unnamed protein product [Didymodactylos carnosus]
MDNGKRQRLGEDQNPMIQMAKKQKQEDKDEWSRAMRTRSNIGKGQQLSHYLTKEHQLYLILLIRYFSICIIRKIGGNQELALPLTTCSCQENIIAHSSSRRITSKQEESSNLKAQIKQQPATDGSLVWKIIDVNDKLNAARSGQQPYLHSPPFFSSPTGYKMCARLYLNGDDEQLNIDEIFHPDSKNPNICGKPCFDTNEPIGIPQFYPLDLLRQKYIKDDTLP